MVRLEGHEPPTHGLEGLFSQQLAASYLAFRLAEGCGRTSFDHLRSTWGQTLGSLAPTQIDTKLIRYWLDRFTLERKWSPQTRLHAINQLASLFNWSIQQGLLEKNPCANIPRPRVQNERRFVISKEQSTRMLDLRPFQIHAHDARIRKAEAQAALSRAKRLSSGGMDEAASRRVTVVDRVLRRVGQAIQASTRGTDFVRRIGGDGFVFVLGECADPRPCEAQAPTAAANASTDPSSNRRQREQVFLPIGSYRSGGAPGITTTRGGAIRCSRKSRSKRPLRPSVCN